MPKNLLINYKLKSAPIIFLNMVFLTNSSDELILFLIMMYHFFLLKKTKSKGMEIFILFCNINIFDTPVGAMLWAIRNRVLCVMVKYYVHIPDPVIKLLVGVIE